MRICIFYMQNDVRNIEKWFKNKAGEVDFWLTSSLKNTRFVDLYQMSFDDCYQKTTLVTKEKYLCFKNSNNDEENNYSSSEP